jgi:hypothetical protein
MGELSLDGEESLKMQYDVKWSEVAMFKSVIGYISDFEDIDNRRRHIQEAAGDNGIEVGEESDVSDLYNSADEMLKSKRMIRRRYGKPWQLVVS